MVKNLPLRTAKSPEYVPPLTPLGLASSKPREFTYIWKISKITKKNFAKEGSGEFGQILAINPNGLL